MPNLQTLIFLIFTLTLMPNHADSQSRKIILGANEQLMVKVLNPEELEEIKAILSVALNIDRDSLDFSMESINKAGASFLWNADNLALEDLHLPCAAYLGEALARQHQLEWEQPEGYNYGILKSKTGRRIDIVERLADDFVDNDYWGVVDLKWTVEGVARMLSAEKE